MTTENMNENIRIAAARGRFTVDESPTDAGTVEMNRAIRRQPEPEPEPAAVGEAKVPAVPDLGQGARGPTAPPADMNDILRGSAVARRRAVEDEVALERQIRQARGRLG